MDKLRGESLLCEECYGRAEGTGHSEEGLLLRAGASGEVARRRDV